MRQNSRRAIGVLLSLPFCIPCLSAQSPPQSLTVPNSETSVAPRSDSAYVLGAGDQMTIRVEDMEQFSDRSVRVASDGSVDLPMIGALHASGLTIDAFKQHLSSKLRTYVTNPDITVSLTENASRTVSVLGEVNQPGLRPLPGPRTLIEVISLAGGVKPGAGANLIVTRLKSRGDLALPDTHTDSSGKFVTATVSLDKLLAGNAPAENIEVEPGDVISIPRGDVVYVVGDVKRAGGFALSSHPTMSLLQAISLAEGFGPNAAQRNAKILRPVSGSSKPREIAVDVKQIFAGKSEDVLLYPNDILFIPSSAAKSGMRRTTDAVIQIATGVAVYGRY